MRTLSDEDTNNTVDAGRAEAGRRDPEAAFGSRVDYDLGEHSPAGLAPPGVSSPQSDAPASGPAGATLNKLKVAQRSRSTRHVS